MRLVAQKLRNKYATFSDCIYVSKADGACLSLQGEDHHEVEERNSNDDKLKNISMHLLVPGSGRWVRTSMNARRTHYYVNDYSIRE